MDSVTFLVFLNSVSVLTLSREKMPSLTNFESGKQLTVKNINKNICGTDLEGQIAQSILKLKKELAEGVKKPFKDIIEANVGNASAGGQKPITFIRQVTGLACFPELLEGSTFPEDVKSRVRDFLQTCQGNSIGSLTDTAGLQRVRRHIAQFIHQRDGCPADWRNIIIVPGVSAAGKILVRLMNMTSRDHEVGAMVPVPHFNLFTQTLTELGIKKIDYYLDERNQWSISTNELKRALSRGKRHSCPRALVIVNPGNPTGHVLTRENMEDVVKFACRENLLIIACEVYQDNVYDNRIFHSFKKVVVEMGAPYNATELISLMSCSKGYAGGSGLRGGYVELFNLRTEVRDLLTKSIPISDSPPICAQIALDCVASPPQPGDPSYSLYSQERAQALSEAECRARAMFEGINSISGLSCLPVEAAFTTLVKVEIPSKAVEKAKSHNLSALTLYVLEMLENDGILVGPQECSKIGNYHFRISTLLEEDTLQEVLQRIRKFHLNVLEKYK